MILLRYKDKPDRVMRFHSIPLNTHALCEVLTGDDSAFIKDLEVLMDGRSLWMSLSDAMRDRLILPNNENTHLCVPRTPEDVERGYVD